MLRKYLLSQIFSPSSNVGKWMESSRTPLQWYPGLGGANAIMRLEELIQRVNKNFNLFKWQIDVGRVIVAKSDLFPQNVLLEFLVNIVTPSLRSPSIWIAMRGEERERAGKGWRGDLEWKGPFRSSPLFIPDTFSVPLLTQQPVRSSSLKLC